MKPSDPNLNQGMYSDKKVADEWISWTKTFGNDSREKIIYPWLTNWVKSIGPKRILEIGSGTGLCSEKVDFGQAEYLGIEPSIHLREYADKQYPNRKFLAGLAEDLPIEDGSYDAVFAMFVWLHISDLSKAAKELARVLKPGGRFAVVTADPDSYKLCLSWYDEPKIYGKRVVGHCVKVSDHEMFFHTMDEYKDSFTQNNLAVDKVKKCPSNKDSGQSFAVIISGYKN